MLNNLWRDLTAGEQIGTAFILMFIAWLLSNWVYASIYGRGEEKGFGKGYARGFEDGQRNIRTLRK
jgi:hypothetical protein